MKHLSWFNYSPFFEVNEIYQWRFKCTFVRWRGTVFVTPSGFLWELYLTVFAPSSHTYSLASVYSISSPAYSIHQSIVPHTASLFFLPTLDILQPTHSSSMSVFLFNFVPVIIRTSASLPPNLLCTRSRLPGY